MSFDKDKNVVISIKNLTKKYLIYDSPSERFKQFFYPKLQRLLRLKETNYFKEHIALENISFEICKGETVGILGINGAGKSTLLQIICGTIPASSGNVKVNGKVAALLELGSGFNLEFTGRENIHLNATILGLSPSQIEERFNSIVKFSELDNFIDLPVKTYSTGMLMRLAFSVIAHVDANILIIDEALSVGDVFFAQKCIRFLKDFMKKGTILFVSHDSTSVINLCNKALLLDEGNLVRIGSPKKVAEFYTAKLLANNYLSENNIKNNFENDTKPKENNLISKNPLGDFKNNEFGKRKCEIIKSSINNQDNNANFTLFYGKENIELIVQVLIHEKIDNLIIGFTIKDCLGQIIFGSNTLSNKKRDSISCIENEIIETRFQFLMPVLKGGKYTIDCAVASGTHKYHIFQHYIYDALAFEMNINEYCYGTILIENIESKIRKI